MNSVPNLERRNQSKFFWKTLSPPIPCSKRIAFRRDLVVLDCQPPSNNRMKVSPTSAILLPCRNTKLTPSMLETSVLPDFQSMPLVMAAFIWDSILRMGGLPLVDELIMAPQRGVWGVWWTVSQLAHWNLPELKLA
jgi:hypothetical protein